MGHSAGSYSQQFNSTNLTDTVLQIELIALLRNRAVQKSRVWVWAQTRYGVHGIIYLRLADSGVHLPCVPSACCSGMTHIDHSHHTERSGGTAQSSTSASFWFQRGKSAEIVQAQVSNVCNRLSPSGIYKFSPILEEIWPIWSARY